MHFSCIIGIGSSVSVCFSFNVYLLFFDLVCKEIKQSVIFSEKVTQEFLCQGSLDKVLEILNIPNQNMTVTTYALQLLILLIQNGILNTLICNIL